MKYVVLAHLHVSIKNTTKQFCEIMPETDQAKNINFFSCDFSCAFATFLAQKRPVQLTLVIVIYCKLRKKIQRNFEEEKKSKKLALLCIVQVVASCSKRLVCEITRETTQKVNFQTLWSIGSQPQKTKSSQDQVQDGPKNHPAW